MPNHTKPKQEKPRGGALASTADLMRATGYSRPVIFDMETKGIISHVEGGKWPMLATLGAMVRKLREKDAGTADRQRKNSAEADTAELNAMTAKGELISRASALAWFADGITEFRRTIERSTELTPTQKTRLLAACAKVKPKGMDL